MAYKLKKFDAESITATQRAWQNDLDHAPNYFPSDVDSKIEFIKKHSNYEDTTLPSFAYGVFAEESHVADSIVEVIITRDGKKFVKMLDCSIRPVLVEKAFGDDDAAIDKLIDIYCQTIVGTFEIADHHDASVVKVYGRTNRLLSVLRIVARIMKDNQGVANTFKVSTEGRWLVVKPAKKGS